MATSIVAAATSRSNVMHQFLSRGSALLVSAAAAAVTAGCRDFVTGVARTPMDVTLTRDSLGVGDSAAVLVTVFGPGDKVVSRPAVRLTVSDTSVARLRGTWLVGQRAGQVILRAESGGQAASVRVIVY
jgi:hypothetical protein